MPQLTRLVLPGTYVLAAGAALDSPVRQSKFQQKEKAYWLEPTGTIGSTHWDRVCGIRAVQG
jgi:hypothetical protein